MVYLIVWIVDEKTSGEDAADMGVSGIWSDRVTYHTLATGDFQRQPVAPKWKSLGEMYCNRQMMIIV